MSRKICLIVDKTTGKTKTVVGWRRQDVGPVLAMRQLIGAN